MLTPSDGSEVDDDGLSLHATPRHATPKSKVTSHAQPHAASDHGLVLIVALLEGGE
jgi:hypothetical protein